MKPMQLNTIIDAAQSLLELARTLNANQDVRNFIIDARDFAKEAKESAMSDDRTYLAVEMRQMVNALELATRYAKDDGQDGIAAMAADLADLARSWGAIQ